MTERYKPCPFCGSKKLISVYFNTEDPSYYAIVCEDCGAVGPKGTIMSDEDTIKWNIRYNHEQLQGFEIV